MDHASTESDLPPIAFLRSLPSSPPTERPPNSSQNPHPKPSSRLHDGSTENSGTGRMKPKPPPPPREERAKGKSSIPIPRVQSIVSERTQLNISSKDAAFVLSIATEEFLGRLVSASQRQAMRSKHQLIALRDIGDAHVVNEQNRLKFLQEAIPKTVTIASAMTMRDKIQNSNANENASHAPAPSINGHAPATPLPNSTRPQVPVWPREVNRSDTPERDT